MKSPLTNRYYWKDALGTLTHWSVVKKKTQGETAASSPIEEQPGTIEGVGGSDLVAFDQRSKEYGNLLTSNPLYTTS